RSGPFPPPGDISGDWSPGFHPPARGPGDEIKAPAKPVEAFARTPWTPVQFRPAPLFLRCLARGAPDHQGLRVLRIDLDGDVAPLGDPLERHVVHRLRGTDLVVRAARRVNGELELDLVAPAQLGPCLAHRVDLVEKAHLLLLGWWGPIRTHPPRRRKAS